jgi:hypothetical protein
VFGIHGERLKLALETGSFVRDFSYKNITDPEWGRGYEWEAKWEQKIKWQSLLDPLAVFETPIDWISISDTEEPIFRWTSDYERHKVCDNRWFLDKEMCWKHYRRGCNMPNGRCRGSVQEIDDYRYPRCKIMIPPSKNYTSVVQCPSPIVQEFREQLKQIKDGGYEGKLNHNNIYALGMKFGVAGTTTEDFLRKYGFPVMPVDAKSAQDMSFCKHVATRWSRLKLKWVKANKDRFLGAGPLQCDEILSSAAQMRRSMEKLETWRKEKFFY